MAQSIRIKRGLQENIDKVVLEVGELALAKDTGNVYIGTDAGKVHLNPPAGTAEEAVKLKNSREFSIAGDVVSAVVRFDGTSNVTLQATLASVSGLAPGTYTKLTVDEKGRVTGGAQIAVSDIPTIPSSKISGLGSAAALNAGTEAGNVVVVGADGKISDAVIPALAIMDFYDADSEAAMLALSCQKGDICIRMDEPGTFILTAEPASVLANWKQLLTPDCKVQSVNGKTGIIVLSAADVGAEPVLKNAGIKSSVSDTDTVVALEGNTTKRIAFSTIKTALKTYFDTLYNKYVHPTHTQHSSGLYKVTIDAQGHVSAASSVTKADITALGIPAQDTVYSLPAATASVLGGVRVGDGLSVDSGVLSVGDVDGGEF